MRRIKYNLIWVHSTFILYLIYEQSVLHVYHCTMRSVLSDYYCMIQVNSFYVAIMPAAGPAAIPAVAEEPGQLGNLDEPPEPRIRGSGSRAGIMKPLVVLALPGMYLFYKYSQYRREQRELSRRSVTERELQHLHHKIVSLWTKDQISRWWGKSKHLTPLLIGLVKANLP